MMRIAVAGVSGRMGKNIVEAVLQTPGVSLGAASDRPGSTSIGQDPGLLCGASKLGITTVEDLSACTGDFDILIDFTSPQASMAHLQLCVQAGRKLVIGTTGFSDEQKAMITEAAHSIAVVFAPNMSVGVNLCFKLVELAAAVMGAEADVEIIEAHHRNKKDAPSGTALKMGEIVASTLNKKLEDCAVYERHGVSGERQAGSIGFETIRAGDIVGDHTVMFATPGERVEITHKSSNRMTYAMGSVRAALWLKEKEKGLYDMQDVLGL